MKSLPILPEGMSWEWNTDVLPVRELHGPFSTIRLFDPADIAWLFRVPRVMLDGTRAEMRRYLRPRHGFTGNRHRGTVKWLRRYAHA